MTKEQFADLAATARFMAAALQAAAEGEYETMTAEELRDETGAEIEWDSAKVYRMMRATAIWTPDGKIEIWEHENFTGEPARIETQQRRATF